MKNMIYKEKKIRKIPLATLLIVTILASISIVDAEKGIGTYTGINTTNKSNISAFAAESQIYFENFQSGWNSWSADNGVWEVGNSTINPVGCYKSSGCAGTVLNGDYPGNTDSSLVGPSIILPLINTGEEIHLRFLNWFSYASSEWYGDYDYAYVAISVYNTTTGMWDDPKQVGSTIFYDSGDWSMGDRDLTKYVGKKIKIYFQHIASCGSYTCSVASGWTVDNVEITKIMPYQHITVKSPNDGESWAAGTKYTIRWAYAGNIGTKVRIDLLKGDSYYREIISSTNIGSGGKGSYNWTIPATLIPGINYKILVTSLYPVYSDISDRNFKIIDIIPPTSITELRNVTYKPTYIKWTWKDPSTYDFSKVKIYINGIFRVYVPKGRQYYNATGLKSDTWYKISAHTIDTTGNINQTWVNRSTKTVP